MIKAVVFDYDGVIADSFSVQYKVTNKMLRHFDKDEVTLEEFKKLFTLDWREFYRIRGVGEELIKLEPELFKKEIDVLKEEIVVFDGIKDVVETLGKKYKLGIVSNNFEDFILSFLKRFEMHNIFSSIVGYMPYHVKPDPTQLILCMKNLKVEPHEVCLIGDMEEDIKMGRRAGVKKIIAVSYGYHHHSRLTGADMVAHSPAEILRLLDVVK
jgi:HAD superfamily hydrolase (TIGR01549 family)